MTMNLSDKKAAILDMDGVITRTADLHARAWKAMFDEFLEKRQGDDGEPFDIDTDYKTYVDGKPRYDGVQSFLQSRSLDLPYGDPDDEPSRQTTCGLGNRKNQLFHEILQGEGVAVFSDTIEQMEKWKREGWRLAVISSSRNCEAILKAAGVLDRFDAKVDGVDLQRLDMAGKPAPDMFLHAAKQLGAAPSETVVVEDAIAGVQAGRKGNFGLVVGVVRNCAGDKLTAAGADIVVRDLRELYSSGSSIESEASQ